jgi:hypothetical protein
MKMQNRKLFLAGAVLVAVSGTVFGYWLRGARAAGVPPAQALTYSGVITDNAGVPATGSKNIQVSLYDKAGADGTLQCSAGPQLLSLVAGGFQLVLPDTCVAAVHAKPDLWAELFVDGTSLGRSRLGAVPYAIEADRAAAASGPFAVPANLTVAGNASVAGTLSVGFHVVSDAASCVFNSGNIVTDCTCGPNEVAVGGGAFGGGTTMLQESRNFSPRVWRVACADGPTGTRTQCGEPQVICARLAQ